MNTSELIQVEIDYAIEKYGHFNSSHEAYAVLIEEVDELWHEVKKKNSDVLRMKEELIQIAAVAIRFHDELENDKIKFK